MHAASAANRAPDGRRSDERTRFSSAKSDDDGGSTARDARAASVNGRRLVATLLVLGCLVAGCSYERVEPGLFGRPMSRQTTAPPMRPLPPADTLPSPNPDLPVVGEAIWTSADGLAITMRLAVHAVRRVEGGTVLDWSVTPLHGPGLTAERSATDDGRPGAQQARRRISGHTLDRRRTSAGL